MALRSRAQAAVSVSSFWKSVTARFFGAVGIADTQELSGDLWNGVASVARDSVPIPEGTFLVKGTDGYAGGFVNRLVQGNGIGLSSFTSVCMFTSRKGFQQTSEFSSATASSGNRKQKTEELWKTFFETPKDWFDNRNDKRSPKAPDFSLKADRNVALWLDGAPAWVQDKVKEMPVPKSREQLWSELFDDPSKWYDNRFDKRNPRAPDFSLKGDRNVALWLDGAPDWVQERVQNMPRPKTREELWNEMFDNPSQWWDNRELKANNERSPKSPDFRLKDDKDIALWINGAPDWVQERLKMMSEQP